MPLTGPFSQLRNAVNGLRALANSSPEITKAMADEVLHELNVGFVNATDPYGQPWAKHMPATVKRWGKHPLLRLTGSGIASVRVESQGTGVLVTSNSTGLDVSQAGYVNQEPRRWKPIEGKVSPRWTLALTRGATNVIGRTLRGAV